MTSLIARRLIQAPAARLFEAWTTPAELVRWWGPQGVECTSASIDLRVGGAYRIEHRFPDGRLLWIAGQFEVVDRPRLLVYSWRVEPGGGGLERVSVAFEPHGTGTEVIVTHEQVPDEDTRRSHDRGWRDCLAGLDVYVAVPPAAR
jgi:uncharacterized protein YndB with AHSA1/START domain